LAGLMWRLRRVPTFEAALINLRCADLVRKEKGGQPRDYLGRALREDATYCDTLGKFSRHEAGLMNAYAKTLHMLLLLQGRQDGGSNGDHLVEIVSLPPKIRDAASQ
jgi:hypothetical protein